MQRTNLSRRSIAEVQSSATSSSLGTTFSGGIKGEWEFQVCSRKFVWIKGGAGPPVVGRMDGGPVLI